MASASSTIRATASGAIDRRRLQGPGHRVDADRPSQSTGMELVAQRIDRLRRRADEDEPGVDSTARANAARSARKP